ncbi:VOC family protein [Natrinema hispanicum]|uniref:Catechol 2,3-dioxygenase n=1 Tax=Natrinema hispanicum TaxID=392421 RepID=A0A1G6SZG5_9EURY|nr:VOC family protein [Natrinema hispanicum]SDD21607.1 catechol 2,3-dioxygenase [Natrinema hispanicum]SET91317.1 catechol 2,3-dioxygenase [Natrinema hispanicum]
MTDTPVIPETARIGRTALLVSDLDEMIDFYRDVVGLTVQTRRATVATLGVDETPLLVLNRAEDVSPRGRAQAGLFHTAFKVPSRAALGAALERIRDRWHVDGASDHYVSEALYLTDPEGNGVEIYTDRPREEWPRAADGTVEIGTVPLDLDDVASQSDGSAGAPPGTTVGHLHLEATSLEAAREFYVDTLGLTVQTEAQSALFLAAGDYHHHLGVNTWHGRSQPAGGRGLAWFEVVVSDDETLTTVRRRLEDADITVSDWDEGIELSDPDGITIRVRAV